MNARATAEAALFALLALGAAVSYALLDATALFWDEYYQLLAARSWADTGTYAVGDGAYLRATWLSVAIGFLFRVFGDQIVVARLALAVVTGAWAVGLFLWVRREVGPSAAWASGLLFALSPVVLVNSVMIRFYGITGVLVLGAVAAAYTLTERVRGWRSMATLIVVVALAAFVAYRIISLAGLWVVGVGVWVGTAAFVYAARRSGRPGVVMAVSGVVGLVVALALWQSGWLANTWTFYRAAPAWGLERGGDLQWYERMIRVDYPVLWGLFPLAAAVSLQRHPRFAGICLTVFVTSLLVLSGAGPKSERYALPIFPYFFVVWGVALPEMARIVWSWAEAAVAAARAHLPARLARLTPLVMTLAVIAFALASNPGVAPLRAVRSGQVRSLDRDGAGAPPRAWDQLAPTLRPLMSEVDAVVTSNSLQVLYHVGDYDYEMRPTVIAELQPRGEFGLDPRTGRHGIGTLESLRRVVRERPTGLVLGEVQRWNHAFEGFTPEVTAWVEANLEPVELPPRLGVRAYRWGPSTER